MTSLNSDVCQDAGRDSLPARGLDRRRSLAESARSQQTLARTQQAALASRMLLQGQWDTPVRVEQISLSAP